MLGSCQPENAALAVQAASVLSRSYPIEKKHIYEGIEKTRWGGRFELHSGSPDIILDGAHNPDGIRRLRESVNQMFGAVPICYVCGVLADKDYEKEITKKAFKKKDKKKKLKFYLAAHQTCLL